MNRMNECGMLIMIFNNMKLNKLTPEEKKSLLIKAQRLRLLGNMLIIKKMEFMYANNAEHHCIILRINSNLFAVGLVLMMKLRVL